MARPITLALMGLVLGLGGCRSLPAASPEAVLFLAGAHQLRAVDAVSLATLRQWNLPAPVVAMQADRLHHRLILLLGGDADQLWSIAADLGMVQREELGFQPVALALDAEHATAFVAGAGHLLALDLDRRQRRQVRLDEAPTALALGPGRELMMATASAAIAIYDADSLRPRATIQLAAPARQLLALPYGHEAFALCGDKLALLDTARAGLLAYLLLGRSPQVMALKPDGGELYVSNADGTVSIVNTSTGEVSGTMAAGLGAGPMAVSPDGTALYVANSAAGSASVLALDTRKTAGVIRIGTRPVAISLAPAGYLFAADAGSDDLAVAHTATDKNNPNSLVALLPSLPSPAWLAVVPR
ncbi:MAG: YncE family protein [Terriglobales bacterium]